MQNFTYHTPTKVIFGKDSELKTAQEIKQYNGHRVLVVYGGKSAVKSGLMAKIEQQLKDKGLAYKLLGGVKPNPLLSFAKKGVELAIEFGADFILAVGGGSVIDTAKGIAHGAANPGTDIWQYWIGERKVEKSLPVGVVLTISAAGSETSNSSVLTNEETGEKRGLSCECNRPKFAIMNPELTYTLPSYQIACGITDIMMHTLDRYFTPTEGNELTDGIAETLLRTTIANGTKAMKNHYDYDAMSELMWCGSLSHNGLTGLGAQVDFAPHKLSHELSGKFDAAHGAALATMWKAWADYVWKEKPERFVRYADKVWDIRKENPEEAVHAGIDATVAYFKSIGMPTCFTELGIGVQNEDILRELADRATGNGSHTFGSFKVIHQNDALEIYKLANH